MPSGYDPMAGHRFYEKIIFKTNNIQGRNQ
jgi:hypothetical protein